MKTGRTIPPLSTAKAAQVDQGSNQTDEPDLGGLIRLEILTGCRSPPRPAASPRPERTTKAAQVDQAPE